ncbi:Alpha/Beta hydrolase protein [Mycena maculata]|uniref:Alpha/Beta hydrolase protein n=1 Tax=Mycena maculata TaxID=230809 RepID=A0AAD7MVU1_9AGAR|nr:Alpha/Beta hydrolase protein [Mycena maculata]
MRVHILCDRRSGTRWLSAATHSTCVLPDGAMLAYEVLGATHLGNALPLVLVCGMASTRADWVRLSSTWAQIRPVLVYDHKGIGDSTSPPDIGVDEFAMETLARDLAFLIGHLDWEDAVAILGFSMGGVVVQQMLVLPYLPTEPTPLPFRPTHVILACTRAEILRDPKYGLQTVPEPSATPKKPQTNAERYENVRRTIEATVDPTWLKKNENIWFVCWQKKSGECAHIIYSSNLGLRSLTKLQLFDFAAFLQRLPPDLPVLIINDQIIPFECSKVYLFGSSLSLLSFFFLLRKSFAVSPPRGSLKLAPSRASYSP